MEGGWVGERGSEGQGRGGGWGGVVTGSGWDWWMEAEGRGAGSLGLDGEWGRGVEMEKG